MHDTPQPRPPQAPQRTGALLAPGELSAKTLESYFQTHLLVWDMPSLHQVFPDITAHLEARYAVERDGETITVHHLDGRDPETFGTDDVRPVVSILLACEFEAALAREGLPVPSGRSGYRGA